MIILPVFIFCGLAHCQSTTKTQPTLIRGTDLLGTVAGREISGFGFTPNQNDQKSRIYNIQLPYNQSSVRSEGSNQVIQQPQQQELQFKDNLEPLRYPGDFVPQFHNQQLSPLTYSENPLHFPSHSLYEHPYSAQLPAYPQPNAYIYDTMSPNIDNPTESGISPAEQDVFSIFRDVVFPY